MSLFTVLNNAHFLQNNAKVEVDSWKNVHFQIPLELFSFFFFNTLNFKMKSLWVIKLQHLFLWCCNNIHSMALHVILRGRETLWTILVEALPKKLFQHHFDLSELQTGWEERDEMKDGFKMVKLLLNRRLWPQSSTSFCLFWHCS